MTYYLLPLVGVNKLTFGRSFKTSYVDASGLKLYVELSKNMHTPNYKTNDNYISEVLVENVLYIMFDIPMEYLNDAAHFIVGTYSKMSLKAKKCIYSSSSLPYNSSMGSFTVSHPILQALDKTKTLRTFLQHELGIEAIPETNELIDKPHKEWFIEHKLL